MTKAIIRKLKSRLWPLLNSAGIAKALIIYDGYADSGSIEHVEAAGHDGKTIGLTATWRGPKPLLAAHPDVTSLHEFLCHFADAVLEEHFGGWQNNDGATGEIIIKVAQRTVSVKHAWRITTLEQNHVEL